MDSGYDYRKIELFFEEHVQCFFEKMEIYDNFANNHPVVSTCQSHDVSPHDESMRLHHLSAG